IEGSAGTNEATPGIQSCLGGSGIAEPHPRGGPLAVLRGDLDEMVESLRARLGAAGDLDDEEDPRGRLGEKELAIETPGSGVGGGIRIWSDLFPEYMAAARAEQEDSQQAGDCRPAAAVLHNRETLLPCHDPGAQQYTFHRTDPHRAREVAHI